MRIKKYNIQERGRNIPLVLAIIATCIIPLLVRFYLVDSNTGQYDWYPSGDKYTDVFSYVKARAILILGFISIIYIGMNLNQVKYKWQTKSKPQFYLFLGVIVSILLATIFSSDQRFGIMGYPERFEGALVWLSYMLIFLSVIIHDWKEKELAYILKGMIASSLVICTLGVLQYFGINYLQKDAIYPLITSFGFPSMKLTINQVVKDNSIYSTLYHYNNYGAYIALVVPFFLSVSVRESNKLLRVVLWGTSIFLIISLWLSTARGGLLALIFAFAVLIILNLNKIAKKNKKKLAFFSICIVIIAGLVEVGNGFETIHRILPNDQTVVKSVGYDAFYLEGNHIYLNGETHKFEVVSDYSSLDTWGLNFYLDGQEVTPLDLGEDQFYHFAENGIENVAFEVVDHGEGPRLALKIEEKIWVFAPINNQLAFINPYGKADQLVNPERVFPFEYDRIGSSRGYIWSRTIPQILKRPLIGYGLDNFPVIFPQEDYYGKYLAYGTDDMIIDKAHNMYLQLLVSGGILLFVSLMGLFFVTLIKFFRNQMDISDHFYRYYEGAILSIISYSIAGLFYDFSVHTSTVVFILLGIGLNFGNLFEKSKEDDGAKI